MFCEIVLYIEMQNIKGKAEIRSVCAHAGELCTNLGLFFVIGVNY